MEKGEKDELEKAEGATWRESDLGDAALLLYEARCSSVGGICGVCLFVCRKL